MEKRELVIIGAGPAGLSAAIYGKRAGLDTLVLEKGRPGGQILTTSRVENYPGIIDGTGTGLADAFRAHAEFFKAEFRSASVQKLEVRGDQKIITLKDGSEIAAGAVIVATGAYFRKQGCPGEKKYTGMGVSYCAVCDASFFEGFEIYVVGGNNIAMEESLYLAKFARKLTMIHKGKALLGTKDIIERVNDTENISILLNSEVVDLGGDELLSEIVVKDVNTGDLTTLTADEEDGFFGLFGFTGKKTTGMFEGILDMDGGYIKTDAKMATNIPGVYAAGDVRVTPLRQVVTACSDGAIAALQCEKYVGSLNKK